MNTLCFTPFPLLTTDRAVLRRLVINDGTEIFKLRTDDRVNRFLDRPLTVSYEDALLFIQERNKDINNNECLYWGIVLQNNLHKIIGTICLWNFSEDRDKAEIGYELSPDFQGMGIMQEVIKSVIDFGFEKLQLKIITADVHSQNTRSLQLLKKCHFKANPTANCDFANENDPQRAVVYSLRNSQNCDEN